MSGGAFDYRDHVIDDIARAVLLGEEKSAAVAQRLRISRRQVYDQTAKAVRAFRAAFLKEAS